MTTDQTVETLYRAEFPRLVRSLAVAFDPESAADAVQEAFIAANQVWHRISKYNDPAAWIRHVALNRLRNDRRNQRRRSEILATIRPVERSDLSAELADLSRALGLLPQQQRIAICMHYLSGYTVAEVSAAMGIASGAVKSHLHDARIQLQSKLKEVDSV